MKKVFIVLLICAIYFGISVATQKTLGANDAQICVAKISTKLYADSFGKTFFIEDLAPNQSTSNNILCFRITDTTKVFKAANYVCASLKDSCGFYNSTIIFYDTAWRTNYDSLFNISGKKILTYKCP